MGNRISYIKKLDGFELVMVIGYVENGKANVFIRNNKLDKVFDLGIVDLEDANKMFSFCDTNITIEGETNG